MAIENQATFGLQMPNPPKSPTGRVTNNQLPSLQQFPITLREVQNMKILFGKYKGIALNKIPLDYLQWLESEKVSQKEDTNSYFMRCLNFTIKWQLSDKKNKVESYD